MHVLWKKLSHFWSPSDYSQICLYGHVNRSNVMLWVDFVPYFTWFPLIKICSSFLWCFTYTDQIWIGLCAPHGVIDPRSASPYNICNICKCSCFLMWFDARCSCFLFCNYTVSSRVFAQLLKCCQILRSVKRAEYSMHVVQIVKIANHGKEKT